MPLKKTISIYEKLRHGIKQLILGKALDPSDTSVHHRLALIAFFAWVGLGADGLSSACYGPAEAFITLGKHTFLAIFVALATAGTVLVISSSYSQIIELFPTGGGGYLVASKLLNPTIGMISGCALLIDYALTITLSIASGTDALFSFLSADWDPYRLAFALFGVFCLTLLNLRGVKESVTTLVPIFMVFVITHAIAIFYGIFSHLLHLPQLVAETAHDIKVTHGELGLVGMILLLLRAYSMGAGTYTGLEAVSNGLPILREPRVQTGKRTMTYMAVSLAVTVFGLMLTYILYDVTPSPEKTLNAVLFEKITAGWNSHFGATFVLVALISEAAILFVAAQAGFIDGPRVLANMAMDRWFPTKFALLSDRLVVQNGILLMGLTALILMAVTGGSVQILLVLYSINVFITFVLSQLGMVRHWWKTRGELPDWKKRLGINGLGLILTSFILISVVIVKFNEGGWVTLLITGGLVFLSIVIRRHYQQTGILLKRLDYLVDVVEGEPLPNIDPASRRIECQPDAKTAVLLVNGYNGLGLHTLLNIMSMFQHDFQNYVFIQVGVVDAGVLKSAADVDHLRQSVQQQLDKYVQLMRGRGYYAEGIPIIGIDVVDEVSKAVPLIKDRFSKLIFFAGQIVFPEETLLTRLLHNYVVFRLQRELYRHGIAFMIMPLRVAEPKK
jgi:amino acid transporter